VRTHRTPRKDVEKGKEKKDSTKSSPPTPPRTPSPFRSKGRSPTRKNQGTPDAIAKAIPPPEQLQVLRRKSDAPLFSSFSSSGSQKKRPGSNLGVSPSTNSVASSPLSLSENIPKGQPPKKKEERKWKKIESEESNELLSTKKDERAREEGSNDKKEENEEVDIYATFVSRAEPCDVPYGTFVTHLEPSSPQEEEKLEKEKEKSKSAGLNYREPESWEVGLVALNEGKFDSEHMSEEVSSIYLFLFSLSFLKIFFEGFSKIQKEGEKICT
jgi:hypothetical protein